MKHFSDFFKKICKIIVINRLFSFVRTKEITIKSNIELDILLFI